MRSSADKVIPNQHNANDSAEGKKPLTPATTGSANIPPPIQVPPTRKIAEIKVPFDGVDTTPPKK